MIEIETPFIKEFRDYHDIGYLMDDLNEVIQDGCPRVRCDEVAFDGCYWGVFWTGRKPRKSTIQDLLDQSCFEADEEPDLGVRHVL